MVTHMNDVQRNYWYPLVVMLQGGEFCVGCGVQPLRFKVIPAFFNLITRKLFYTKILLLDHIDNDPNHNELHNFQLLCRSCNRIKNPSKISSKSTREKTPEMERRDTRESVYREYIFDRVLADNFTEFKDLVASACEDADLAYRTGLDIIAKMVSTRGVFKKFEFEGESYVCFKSKYNEIMDELEKQKETKRNLIKS